MNYLKYNTLYNKKLHICHHVRDFIYLSAANKSKLNKNSDDMANLHIIPDLSTCQDKKSE